MLPICAALLVDMHVLGCLLCAAHVFLEVACILLSFLHMLGSSSVLLNWLSCMHLGMVVGDVGYSAHFSLCADGGPCRCFTSVGECLYVFYFCFV